MLFQPLIGHGALQQELVCSRRVPTDHCVLQRIEYVLGARFGRSLDGVGAADPAQAHRAVAGVFMRIEGGDLVSRRGLPRQTQIVVVVIPVGVRDPIQIGYIEQFVRTLVVIGALDVLLRTPVTVRGVEPEPVARDGAAKRTTVVLELLD